MNWLRARIHQSPTAFGVIGKCLLLAGATMIVGAVFARAGLMGINADRLAAHLPVFRALAEAYPQYPTWMVPEGSAGYIVSALLVLAGTALAVIAGEASKKIR